MPDVYSRMAGSSARIASGSTGSWDGSAVTISIAVWGATFWCPASSVMSRRAPAWSTRYAMASPPRRRGSGTRTAPAASTPKSVIAVSGDGGSEMAMRSPRPTPRPASAPAARAAPSCTSPNVTARTSPASPSEESGAKAATPSSSCENRASWAIEYHSLTFHLCRNRASARSRGSSTRWSMRRVMCGGSDGRMSGQRVGARKELGGELL